MNDNILRNIKRITATSLVGFTLFFPNTLGKSEKQDTKQPIVVTYRYLDNLPNCIEEIIVESGIDIVIVGIDGKLENMSGYSSVKGLFRTRTNTIYIEGLVRDNVIETYRKKGVDEKLLEGLTDYSLSQKISIDTFFHEIGHVIDKYFNNASQTREFKKIHSNEKQGYKQTTEFKLENRNIEANIKTSIEYFASAFACYILYPDDLKLYAPDTYSFIDGLIKEYENNKTSNKELKILCKKLY